MTKPGKELLFLALGGSGEIGMNVNLYGCDGKWVMADCGATFADPRYPGIDIILPDLNFIEERARDLLGIVITHGHEDHIGALAYFAADLGVPIYATPFTAGLIAGKLEEEGVAKRVKLVIVERGGSVTVGPFAFTYVPVAHSIPEGNALLIETPYGRVLHTGDWKLDDEPVIGEPTTPAQFEAIGDAGVLALVCDSTNAFNAQPSGSEASVREGLMEVVGAAKGRVMVTTFASNAARLDTLGEVAKATGRTLCVAGRSLDRIIRVGQANGYLKKLPPTVDYTTAMGLPRNQVLIVATGGQGEERATLARVAFGQHQLKLDAGDTVVFSSRQIPGNETAIGRIQNALAAKNVLIVTERQAHVHVSGHPGRPELEAMYGWIRPQMLVPVHGEMRHLAEQARLGLGAGIPRAIVQSNGDVIRLAPNGPVKIGTERVGRLVLDGDVMLAADGASMNERRRLALNGLIGVSYAVDDRGAMRGDPVVRVQGLPVEEDRDDFIADVTSDVRKAITNERARDRRVEAVRLVARRCATRWTGKKPVVEVVEITL